MNGAGQDRYSGRPPLFSVINSVDRRCRLEGVAQFCVGYDDEFSHHGGEGDHWLFAVFDQALVGWPELRVAFAGAHGGEEQCLFDLRPPAACALVADCGCASLGVRGNARQCGGLAPVERAEFGHEGKEGCGGCGADALYVAEHLFGLAQLRRVLDERGDGGFDGGDLVPYAGQDRFEMGSGVPGPRRFEAVGPSDPVSDHILAGQDKRLKFLTILTGLPPQGQAGLALFGVGQSWRASMSSLLPKMPKERMKALTLRASAR